MKSILLGILIVVSLAVFSAGSIIRLDREVANRKTIRQQRATIKKLLRTIEAKNEIIRSLESHAEQQD